MRAQLIDQAEGGVDLVEGTFRRGDVPGGLVVIAVAEGAAEIAAGAAEMEQDGGADVAVLGGQERGEDVAPAESALAQAEVGLMALADRGVVGAEIIAFLVAFRRLVAVFEVAAINKEFG